MSGQSVLYSSAVSLRVTLKSDDFDRGKPLTRDNARPVGIPRLPPERPRASREMHEEPAEERDSWITFSGRPSSYRAPEGGAREASVADAFAVVAEDVHATSNGNRHRVAALHRR